MKNSKTLFLQYIPFLLLISFISFINILARIIFVPLTPTICKQMNLCHADTGNLFFILSFGFAIALFTSQFISSKVSHKKTVIFSIFSTGLALIISSYSNTFLFFRWSLFIVGVCSGLFIPSAVAMIRESVRSDHLGKAFGIFATSQSLAFILGPMMVKYLILFLDWNEILNRFGFFSCLFGIVLYFLLKTGESCGTPITLSFVRNVFSWPSFWILIILLCLANGLNIGIYNMSPDYFQGHNLLSSHKVYNLTMIARIFSLFTTILAGIFTDRYGLKRSMVATFVFCGLLTSLMGIVPPSSSLTLFCLQSPVAACLMPLIHLGIATIVSPQKNAAIVSISAPFGFLMGAGFVPQILGLLGDFNLYAQGFILFGLTSIFCGIIFNSSAIYRQVEISQIKSLESE